MRISRVLVIVLGVPLLFAFPPAIGGAADDDDEPRVRLGVYDNRSIAIAFAPSEFNPVGEKMKAYEAAKAAGDEQRVAELEAWGEARQRQLHRQGFARVPVDDLLVHVKEMLPAIAQRRGVAAIVWQCDYAGPHVERVDVTMELVRLFDPSEQTLRWAEQIREQPFVDLDALQHGHHH